MMHCLQINNESPVKGDATKLVAEAYDKQTTAAEIDALVDSGLSVLEAVTWWMEERSLPEAQFARYIPEAIIEQLKLEVIEDNILKPSLTKQNTHSTLDFLYG